MLFPESELAGFVHGYFRNKERYLDILKTSLSPVYILETDILRQRADRFRRTFMAKSPDCGFYFAMKSNNHPRVSETLLAMHYGLDVSSGAELETAILLGAQDIVFSGPGKTEDELAVAVQNHGAVTILLDSFEELNRLERAAAARDRLVRAGVRLTTNPAGLWRKFGIPLEDLPAFFRKAGECPHVRLQGLQFHTSWNLSPRPQCDFIAALGLSLRGLSHEALDRISFVDVGGGYWPEQGEWLRAEPSGGNPEGANVGAPGAPEPPSPLVHCRLPAAPLDIFAEDLFQAIGRYLQVLGSCRICFEPGRWICNDAMHLFLTVMDKKAPDLVIADAGINAIGWDRFESDYFPILNLSRPSMRERECTITGSLCTPHDIFGYSFFGDDIRVGDILMIPCQGAYTYSLRQAFIKPVPAVVAV